jgi:hypothetical protein
MFLVFSQKHYIQYDPQEMARQISLLQMSTYSHVSPSNLLYFVRKRMDLFSDIVFLPSGNDYPLSKLSSSCSSAMRKVRPMAKMLATFIGLALWVREEVETSIRETSARQALTYFWKLARVPNAKLSPFLRSLTTKALPQELKRLNNFEGLSSVWSALFPFLHLLRDVP